MPKLTKAQLMIQKLEKDIEIYQSMERHYRGQGFLDAYHFYRGKISACRMMIAYLMK